MASNLGHGVHIDAGEIVQSTEWRRATRHMAFVSVVTVNALPETNTRDEACVAACFLPGENLTQLLLQAVCVSLLMLDDRWCSMTRLGHMKTCRCVSSSENKWQPEHGATAAARELTVEPDV